MRVAPADFGFHSGVWGLKTASGMMLRLMCGLMETEIQTASLV